MFCTLMLISCIVLVTSSMAEEACNPNLAASSDSATQREALATCDEASPTLRTSPAKPSTMREKALPSVTYLKEMAGVSEPSPEATSAGSEAAFYA